MRFISLQFLNYEMNLLKKIIKVLNKKDNKEKEFHTEIIIKYKNIISVEDIISSSFSKFLGNTLIGSEASYFSLNTKQLGTGKIIGMYLVQSLLTFHKAAALLLE